jgi:O-antigen/teichoic acid export membrane protein
MIGFESISLILSTLILTLIIEIIHIIYSTRFLRISFSFKNFNFLFFKELFVFSSYLFINLLTDQINWNIDKYIIGLFHGTGSVAVYSLAGQLVLYYIAISTAISSVFIPRVHKLVNMNNEIELSFLFLKIGRIQFIVLSYILTGIIFFGKEFIVLWAGENYLDSYNILLLLLIPLTIPLIQNIGLEIQRAKNMHKFRSILFIFIAIINIGISIPLTKEYGVIGATLGTSLSLLIGNGILINLYNYTKVKIDILNFWRQILSFAPGLFVVFLFSFIIKHFVLITNFSDLFISGSVYSVLFLIAFWYLGFNSFEKALLIKPLKYFFRI